MAPKPVGRPSLAVYAQTRADSRRNQCWLCSIPERTEVEEARKTGVQVAAIVDWLNDVQGYDGKATPNKVSSHLLTHAKIRVGG